LENEKGHPSGVSQMHRDLRQLRRHIRNWFNLDEIKVDTCSNCHPFYTGKQTQLLLTTAASTASRRHH
jgi:ribosomal protein L31